jgi:hypothetical protein
MKSLFNSHWFRVLRFLAVVYGCVALFACAMADRMIFMPPHPSYSADAPSLVTLQTANGNTVAAFHYPAKPGAPTVLYSHGNAEDAGHSIELYQAWQKQGWGVLAYDYPGYGQSPGKPSEAGTEEAIEAAWNFLTDDQGLAPSDIVVVGRSVGSGPSVWLIQEKKPAALILISPFTSAFAVLPPAQYLIPANRFPNLSRIRKSEVPLLVIHGETDGVITTNHGRTLHAESPANPKQFVGIPNVGHNDLFHRAGAEVLQAIDDFVGQVRKSVD